MKELNCAVCQNKSSNKVFVAREMNFGLRDRFEYFECASCGCVQIKETPADLSQYYPPQYYAGAIDKGREGPLKRFLKHQRAKHCLYGGNMLGMLLARRYGRPVAEIFGKPDHYTWLKRCNLDFASDILDVGCNSGNSLLSMSEDGFSNLTGIDPFIEKNIDYKPGLRILKADVRQMDGQFDFVMLHHTFEHMEEPLAAMKQFYRLLKHDRFLLIRTPVASSFSYRKYGANWVQLDAPRHLFVHTLRSIHSLAANSGFHVVGAAFDSTEFQFWGSEQYVVDIPLRDSRSYAVDPRNSMFSKEQITAFRQQAEQLNRSNDGDSACFYLYKASSSGVVDP
jgi:SAM-dependent methyltransferase